MKVIPTGTVVDIPVMNVSGIVCGFDTNTSTYVVEVDYGWLEGVKRSEMAEIKPSKAPVNHDSFVSYAAGVR